MLISTATCRGIYNSQLLEITSIGLDTVSFTARITGTRATFDEAAYISSVATVAGVSTDMISVTYGARRALEARQLQGSFSVVTTVIAASAAVAAYIETEIGAPGTLTTALAASGIVAVVEVPPTIAAVIVYPPPPSPPVASPSPVAPGLSLVEVNGTITAALSEDTQNAVAAGMSMPAVIAVFVVIGIIGCAMFAGGTYLVRNMILKKRTSTIVKAVPVTTISNPASVEITSTSASSAEPDKAEALDETKI